MRIRSSVVPLFVLVVLAALTAIGAPALASSEIKGAAILDHPCGKVAVKHMGLVHAGKMDEATKLGTAKMQAEWKALPAEDREMMSGMMQEMSQTTEEFTAAIKEYGALVVDGKSATLTIVKKVKDENGESTETTTQKYELDGATCAITH